MSTSLKIDRVCLCDDNADRDFCASLQKGMQGYTHLCSEEAFMRGSGFECRLTTWLGKIQNRANFWAISLKSFPFCCHQIYCLIFIWFSAKNAKYSNEVGGQSHVTLDYYHCFDTSYHNLARKDRAQKQRLFFLEKERMTFKKCPSVCVRSKWLVDKTFSDFQPKYSDEAGTPSGRQSLGCITLDYYLCFDTS